MGLFRRKAKEKPKPPAMTARRYMQMVRPRGAIEGKTEHDHVPSDFTGWNEILTGQALWTQADNIWDTFSISDLEQVYKKHAVVMACVREIATSIAEPPLQVGVEVDGEFEPVEGHWLTDLLKRPNNTHTYNEFVQFWVMASLLTGRGFLWKWRTSGDVMSEIWPIPSSWVRLKLGSGNQPIEHYEIGDLMDPQVVALLDMVYFRFPDPTSLWNGCGPLQAALHDYQLDEERQNYLVEMLTNLKVPGMTLKQESGAQPLGPEQRKELRESLEDITGYGRRGGSPILPPGITLEFPGYIQDMDWPGLTTLSESRICSAYGVPPIIIGARVGLERSTYSNYEQAVRSFYAETLKPFWESLQGTLTKGLLHDEGDVEHVVQFDLSGIEALQEDLNRRSERATALFTSGIVPRHRAQEMVGEEPLGPNVFIMPATMVEIPVDVEAAEEIIKREEATLRLVQPEEQEGADDDEEGGVAGQSA